jgi:hypothetical protein
VHGVEQLRAIQHQRWRHLVVMAVAVSAHPVRAVALDEVHALRELLPVDDAILPRDVVVLRARRVRLRVELQQFLRGGMDSIRGDSIAREWLARPDRPGHRARRRIE